MNCYSSENGSVLICYVYIQLVVVLQKVNNCFPAIKFQYQISKAAINFLYTTVFKVGNQLRTKLYTRPTHKQSYLHSKSDHPRSMKNSNTYSEALRLNKI